MKYLGFIHTPKGPLRVKTSPVALEKRSNSPENDEFWMLECLRLAKTAAKLGEVPVAAIIVSPEGPVSWAINARERKHTVLGHAELLAIHKASQKRQSWRLEDCTLYVSLEPCVMCAGGIQQARLQRVVFGALDPKAGGTQSLYNILNDKRLNHQCDVTGPVLQEKASALLKSFFEEKRSAQKKTYSSLRVRTSAVIVHENKLLTFRAIDPTSGQEYFFLPGGKIEDNEEPITCAARETFEETGYEVQLLSETALEKKYPFHWDGNDWMCLTHFFLGHLVEGKTVVTVKDASYNKGPAWIPLKDVEKVFSYSQDIKAAVQKLLKKSHLLQKTN